MYRGSRQRRNVRSRPDQANSFMTTEPGWIFRTKEYRGCGIRAASYEVGSRGWVPEACFWLYTDRGWRQLWINSFAHCLAAPNLTFPNKLEADACAFSLARRLIDRALLEFDSCTSQRKPHRTTHISKMLNLVLRPLSRYNIFGESRERN
jgi:hypothetical protein